ncbi:MAG: LuxR C-terminal-related transcriptional regulator [Mucinivorans sp.]
MVNNTKHGLVRGGFWASLYAREIGVEGRQRVIIMVYASLMIVVGVTLNLFNLTGPQELFFNIANATHGVLTIVLFICYYYRLISLKTSLALLCIVTQLELSAETAFCIIHSNPYNLALTIGNMVLSAIILLLSVIAHLNVMPYVVAAMSMAGYAISILITGSEVISNFFFVFLLLFILLSVLGWKLNSNTTALEHENSELKDEQQQVLNMFHMSKEQMRSYVTLARKKRLKPEKTAELLKSLGGNAERQIRDNVAYYIKQTSIDLENIRERMPELTASETEICALILKDKKLKEISQELDKSPSNITCQRTNIRTKFGLKKEDNLYLFLVKKMENKE